MSKSLSTVFSFIFIVLITAGCTAQDDDGQKKNIIISEKYEPCCSNATEVNKELAEGFNVFIPNVFTPNGDGINDYFYPIFDATRNPEVAITYFTLFDSDNHSIRRTIFSSDWFNPNDIKNYAFSGYYYKDNIRTLWEGQFWYSIRVSLPSGVIKIEGSACSVVCDEESAVFRDKKDCFFPAQVTPAFKGDNKLNNLEKDCFY